MSLWFYINSEKGLSCTVIKIPIFIVLCKGNKFCQYWLFRLGIAQFYCQQKYNIKENCAQNNKTEQDVDVQLKVTLAGDVYYVA